MTTAQHGTHGWLAWIGTLTAVLATVAIMLVIVRLAPSTDQRMTDDGRVHGTQASTAGKAAARSPGVLATIRAGDVVITRTLPALSFALGEDQTLDMRLPPGEFSAEFDATFRIERGTRARFGAEVEGGTVDVIWRGAAIASSPDSTSLDLSGTSGAPPRVSHHVMSEPVAVPARPNTVTYRFTSHGGPTRLRAMWQPAGAQTPLPLPASGPFIAASDALRGRTLFEKLNCLACHQPRSGDRLGTTLAGSPAPILGDVGARARPQWIRAWLADPHALKPDTAMPRIFDQSTSSNESIENLVHFLASMGGPLNDHRSPIDAGAAATGQLLYHQVGCFACHGSYVGDGELPVETPEDAVASLGDLHLKTTSSALGAFLRDPLAVRPSGRMPSLDLQETEAAAIAQFLISLGETSHSEAPPIKPDPIRIEAGRNLFASLGCASCHALGPNRPILASTLAAPDLESIATLSAAISTDRELRGCLASQWQTGTPRFALNASERRDLAEFLVMVSLRRSNDVPHDRLGSALTRFNCLACHEYQNEGGPAARLARHFTTHGEADLGDEGRLPPPLTEVGANLNAQWLRTVLMDHGRVRPYVAVRMPHFGHAVAELAPLFASVCGAGEATIEPPFTSDLADAGRTLVGGGGLNCLQCHSIAGRAGTGTPGVDLATTVERLRFDYFDRWLHDPSQLSPGTRMPTFFVDGASGLTDILGGSSRSQIDAIWCYLSQGEMLPLPEGLLDPSSLELEVIHEPLVLRTFMKEAGVRAIACGFPEQIHCAFDSEACAITAAWEGAFLNASGAWAGRGGTETNPKSMAWTTDRDTIIGLCTEDGAFSPAIAQFRGYELDERRRPTFMYRAKLPAGFLDVEQKPIAHRTPQRAMLRNQMTFRGTPGTDFCVALPVEPGNVNVQLDATGAAQLDWEISW